MVVPLEGEEEEDTLEYLEVIWVGDTLEYLEVIWMGDTLEYLVGRSGGTRASLGNQGS